MASDRSFSIVGGEPSGTMFIGPSSEPKSMLADLTAGEQAALNEWSAGQKGDPERGGVIDMMKWPGWAAVIGRKFKDQFGVDPTGRAD